MAEELKIKITAEAEQAQKELSKTQQAITNFSSKVKKAGATVVKATAAAVVAGGAAIVAITKQAVAAYGEYEQLAGGAKKIFDDMDYSRIANDATQAWRTMNLSANEYLTMINQVGASFAATMGDEKGYQTAQKGMQAISDYASGTGRNITELNNKFSLITRSTQSYQSIADQFSGILPATSAGFLEQAQACGFLSSEYTKLTEVPVAEYQEAVALMLEKGVADLNLTGNTAKETSKTITGSIAGMKAAWQNLLVAIVQGNGELDGAFNALVESIGYVFDNLAPVVEQALMGIGTVIERLAPVLGEKLPALVSGVLPSLLGAITGLIQSLATSLPAMIQPVMTAIVAALPDIIEAGIALFAGLVSALVQIIPQLVSALPQIWEALKAGFAEAWPMIKEAGLQLMQMAGEGIASAGEYVKGKASEIWEAIKAKASEVWEAIKGKISAVWSGITSSVSSGVNTVKTVVSSAFSAVSSTVSSIWNSIKSTITSCIDGAKEKVKSAIDKIKSFFNFSWNLPHLKMPHITITGEFSLVPPSVPHFSISWYKLGGVFDSPTLFGYGNGQIGGLGEDGAEAIVPLENNIEWLDRLAERLGEKIGNNPIVLEVDGKVFGQIACDSINGLTRQTGRLNIVMA